MIYNMVNENKKMDVAKNVVMGSAQVVAMKLANARRDLNGSDFRCHNGARGQVHASKKDYNRKAFNKRRLEY